MQNNMGLYGIVTVAAIASGCAQQAVGDLEPFLFCEEPAYKECTFRTQGVLVQDQKLLALDILIKDEKPILTAFDFDPIDRNVFISYTGIDKETGNWEGSAFKAEEGDSFKLMDGARLHIGKIDYDVSPRNVFVYVVDSSVEEHTFDLLTEKDKMESETVDLIDDSGCWERNYKVELLHYYNLVGGAVVIYRGKSKNPIASPPPFAKGVYFMNHAAGVDTYMIHEYKYEERYAHAVVRIFEDAAVCEKSAYKTPTAQIVEPVEE